MNKNNSIIIIADMIVNIFLPIFSQSILLGFDSALSSFDKGTDAITINIPIIGLNRKLTQNEVLYPIFFSLPNLPINPAMIALIIRPATIEITKTELSDIILFFKFVLQRYSFYMNLTNRFDFFNPK